MRLLHPDVVESSLGVAGSHCAMDLVTASDEFSQDEGDFQDGLVVRRLDVDQLNVLHFLAELGCCCCGRTATSVTLQPNSELAGQVATLQDDVDASKYRDSMARGKAFAPFPPKAITFSRALGGCCASSSTQPEQAVRRVWLISALTALMLPALFLFIEAFLYQALWVLPPVRHPQVLLRAFGQFSDSSFSGGFGDSADQKWRLALFFCINSIPVLVAPLHFMLLNTHVPAWSKQPIAMGLALAGVVTVLLVVEIIPRALNMYPLFGLALPAAVGTNLVVQSFQFTHVLNSKFFKRTPLEHAEEFEKREAASRSLMRHSQTSAASGNQRRRCAHFSTELECNWNLCACLPASACKRGAQARPKSAARSRPDASYVTVHAADSAGVTPTVQSLGAPQEINSISLAVTDELGVPFQPTGSFPSGNPAVVAGQRAAAATAAAEHGHGVMAEHEAAAVGTIAEPITQGGIGAAKMSNGETSEVHDESLPRYHESLQVGQAASGVPPAWRPSTGIELPRLLAKQQLPPKAGVVYTPTAGGVAAPMKHLQLSGLPSSRSAGGVPLAAARHNHSPPSPVEEDSREHHRSGSVVSFTSSALSDMASAREATVGAAALAIDTSQHRRSASLAAAPAPAPPAAGTRHSRVRSMVEVPSGGAMDAKHCAALAAPFSISASGSQARSLESPAAGVRGRHDDASEGNGDADLIKQVTPRHGRFASAPPTNEGVTETQSQCSDDTWADMRPSCGVTESPAAGGRPPTHTSTATSRRLSMLGWHPRKLSVDSVDAAHTAAWEHSMRRRQWWSIGHTVLAVMAAFGSALMFRTTFAQADSPVMQVLLNVFIVSALAFMRFVVLHTAKWSRSGAAERCSCLQSMLPLTSERCLQCMFELNLRLSGSEAQGSGSKYTPEQPDPRFVWRGYHIVEVALAGAERRLASPFARRKIQKGGTMRALYTLEPLPGTVLSSRSHSAWDPPMKPPPRLGAPGGTRVVLQDADFIDDAESAPGYAYGSFYSDDSAGLPEVGKGEFGDLRAQQLVPPIKLPQAEPSAQVRLHMHMPEDGSQASTGAGGSALLLPAYMPSPVTYSCSESSFRGGGESKGVAVVHFKQLHQPRERAGSALSSLAGGLQQGSNTAHVLWAGATVGAGKDTLHSLTAESFPCMSEGDREVPCSPMHAATQSWDAPPSEGSNPFIRDADQPPALGQMQSRVSFISSDWQGDVAILHAKTTPQPLQELPQYPAWYSSHQSNPHPVPRVQAQPKGGALAGSSNRPPEQDDHRSVSGVAAQIAQDEAKLFHELPVIHLNLWSNESQDRVITMFITMILELFTAFALTDIVSPTVFGVLLLWQCARLLAAHGMRFVLTSEHQKWAMQRFASRLPLVGPSLCWMLDRIAVDRVSNLDVRIAYYKLLLQTYLLQPDAHADVVRAMACVADVPVRLTRRGSLASDVSGTLGSSVAGLPSSVTSSPSTAWGTNSGGALPVLRLPALSRTTDAQIRQMLVLRSAQNSMMHMGATIAANIFFAVALALDRIPQWPYRIRLVAFVTDVQVQRGALYGAVQLPVLVAVFVCCCWLMRYYRGINASAVWVSLYTHRRSAIGVMALLLLLGQYANSFYFQPPDSETT